MCAVGRKGPPGCWLLRLKPTIQNNSVPFLGKGRGKGNGKGEGERGKGKGARGKEKKK